MHIRTSLRCCIWISWLTSARLVSSTTENRAFSLHSLFALNTGRIKLAFEAADAIDIVLHRPVFTPHIPQHASVMDESAILYSPGHQP